MNTIWILATEDTNPWIGPAIVAAAVSGLVALTTVGLNARQARKDRQRQLFAEAFTAIQLYKEFPYRIRRRRSDKKDEAAADIVRLTTEFSDVQAKLNDYASRLRVEAPRVGVAYAQLLDTLRRIAGGEARRSWNLPPTAGADVSITDIDLSGLTPSEDRYLVVVAEHLSLWPAAARAWHGLRNRLRSSTSG